MPFSKVHEVSNRMQFLSPPVTPKQIFETSFHTTGRHIEEEYWDSTSTEASSSPSSSSYYLPTLTDPKARTKNTVMFTSIVLSSKRKQTPVRSLPASTEGTFLMPTFITSPAKKKTKKHVNINTSQQKHPTPPLPSKDGPSPLPTIIKSVAPNQKVEDSVILAPEVLNDQQKDEVCINKKAKTSEAYIYDTLSADWDQAAVFLNNEHWIPNVDVFNRRPMVRISWKGSPLKIRNMPYFEKLHAGEVTIAATLRLTPEQYLKCKWALILAAKDASENNTLFRKSEAQKVCCIDVNKTSVLWNAFGKLGWLGSKWPQ
ncbi:hypothetical protein INT47_007622 [Mucor saturninus]|uniref:SWIRM domain-containing protein n=1 Tax=Mucor saturninus TaxID=64648 RepID=A0A8H7RAS4_9FUNG|nr:hypothetical protein INT47_007622 [Mucor saturninus]